MYVRLVIRGVQAITRLFGSDSSKKHLIWPRGRQYWPTGRHCWHRGRHYVGPQVDNVGPEVHNVGPEVDNVIGFTVIRFYVSTLVKLHTLLASIERLS